NGDGKTDMKDRSVLWYTNLAGSQSYPLTLSEASAFRGRWFSVFPLKYANSQDVNYGGVILYSEQAGENININLIPEYGIIPRRKSAEDQLDLAEGYLLDEGAGEKYELALSRVYDFFGKKKDFESVIAESRSLYRAAALAFNSGDSVRAKGYNKKLLSLSSKEKDFAAVTAAALEKLLAGKALSAVYDAAIGSADPRSAEFPYLLDDAAAVYSAEKNFSRAKNALARIAKDYPSYRRISYVNYSLAVLSFESMTDDISPWHLDVLRKGRPFQKDRASADIVRFFAKDAVPAKRIGHAGALYEKYSSIVAGDKSDKGAASVMVLCDYVTGAAYLEAGDLKRAEEFLSRAEAKLRTSEIIYYEANLKLAQCAEKYGDPAKEEKYLFAAATSYLN
ncbi:MAG: hypothetical protein ACRCUT_04845, partial [Spirochaetota bacterium]